jgi:pullulanase/glycogen debranching enzyme
MMNMFSEPLDFELPAARSWRIAIDTFAPSPLDIAEPGAGPAFAGARRTVSGQSIVVFERTE